MKNNQSNFRMHQPIHNSITAHNPNYFCDLIGTPPPPIRLMSFDIAFLS
jgi:hypothetical protein